MIKMKRLFCLSIVLMLFSCGESDLTPDYIAEAPKVLAIKIEDPEVEPGSPVRLRLLVGGNSVDQTMTTDVNWFLGLDETAEGRALIGTSAYDSALEVIVPDTVRVMEPFDSEGWLDVPIFAQITLDGRALTAEKTLRVTKEPVGKNPVITGIRVRYRTEDLIVSNALNDEIFIDGDIPSDIAFTAMTHDLGTANDTLIYRWHVSRSKNGAGKLYVNTDSDDIAAVIGPGELASEFLKTVVFSLYGEKDNDGDRNNTPAFGKYDVYLIVRDKAADAQTRAEDRFGLDFYYFTLVF